MSQHNLIIVTEDLLLLATAKSEKRKVCTTITELVVVWSLCRRRRRWTRPTGPGIEVLCEQMTVHPSLFHQLAISYQHWLCCSIKMKKLKQFISPYVIYEGSDIRPKIKFVNYASIKF